MKSTRQPFANVHYQFRLISKRLMRQIRDRFPGGIYHITYTSLVMVSHTVLLLRIHWDLCAERNVHNIINTTDWSHFDVVIALIELICDICYTVCKTFSQLSNSISHITVHRQVNSFCSGLQINAVKTFHLGKPQCVTILVERSNKVLGYPISLKTISFNYSWLPGNVDWTMTSKA